MKEIKLSLIDLDIQLNREIERTFQKVLQSRQNPDLDKSHPGSLLNYELKYPSKFRLIRALAIASWFLSNEELRWRLILDLGVDTKFFWTEEDKFLQIYLILSSKENCIKFLRNNINPRELFGTILRDDLQSALLSIRIKKKNLHVKKKVRRKGYQDHGSRRPGDRWLESFDFSFNEIQNLKEEKLDLLEHSFQLQKLLLESEGPEA